MTTVGPTRPGSTGDSEDGPRERPGEAEQPGGVDEPEASSSPKSPKSSKPSKPSKASRWADAARFLARPVPASLLAAGVLHLLWVWLFANSGGDLAAQDAWAEFVGRHPASAYNLAWYGGMHPVSYSVISPYLMHMLGVRTTMIVAGTVSAGLLALLLVRSRAVRRPLWPGLYGAFALTCNAVSGRVTYGLGVMFGLAAVAVIFAWPVRWRSVRWEHKWARAALAGLLAALATASSPVAGLYVGFVAAALWLGKRRPAAYALGLPPAAVVALSAWLFPFSGQQPMSFPSAVLPLLSGVFGFVFAPKRWRTVRMTSALYVLGVLLVWLIPSQIGTNISRLGMIFSGVLLVAVWTGTERPPRRELLRTGRGRKWIAMILALVTVTAWQLANSIGDAVNTTPAASWARELAPLVDRLQKVDAERGRVEVVPARSHREASALAPYVNLARGWNRQADRERNPLFYEEGMLTSASYHEWLGRWAVHYVVLPTGEPDNAAEAEAKLVAAGQPYLREVWSDANWKLYEVSAPTPLADPPAVVRRADAGELTVTVKSAGPVRIRIPYSPWLGLVDKDGKAVEPPKEGKHHEPPVNVNGCLTKQVQIPKDEREPEDAWTVLHAPHAGTYRVAAPYKFPRGTMCPEGMPLP